MFKQIISLQLFNRWKHPNFWTFKCSCHLYCLVLYCHSLFIYLSWKYIVQQVHSCVHHRRDQDFCGLHWLLITKVFLQPLLATIKIRFKVKLFLFWIHQTDLITTSELSKVSINANRSKIYKTDFVFKFM